MEFGRVWGLDLHKEVYYGLDKIQKNVGKSSSLCFENAEPAPIAGSNISRAQFKKNFFLNYEFFFTPKGG